jgi:hypothetical protein
MHKETHEFTSQVWNAKSAAGCIIGKEKMANIIKDVLVYRHADTDHFY